MISASNISNFIHSFKLLKLTCKTIGNQSSLCNQTYSWTKVILSRIWAYTTLSVSERRAIFTSWLIKFSAWFDMKI